MKKLLTILAIALTSIVQAQPQITAGYSLEGFSLRVALVSNEEIIVAINQEYEKREDYDYYKFGFGLGRRLYLGQKVELLPIIEFGTVQNMGLQKFTYGIATETIYYLNESIGISAFVSFNNAKDLDIIKGGTNVRLNAGIGINYKFKI